MRRRLIVLAVVVVVSGLVPLIATAGSCSEMSCCRSHGVTLHSDPGCCGPDTCLKEERAARTSASSTDRAPGPLSVAFRPAALRPAIERSARSQISWSPPGAMQDRLSLLSVLLI